ncbi:MAG: hypothetical protein JNM24_00290 [Bdellovibrionaceae bacterium]|nr:hypothetical protein [Pseudobdellovibrionaceae bacterium]
MRRHQSPNNIKTLKIFLLRPLLAILGFSSGANALSKRPLRAEDPHAKAWVATSEFSPYSLMTVTSYLNAFGAVLYFAPVEKSPDYDRQQVKDANSAAAGVVLAGAMLNGLFAMISSPMISDEERLKLGPLSATDIDDASLQRERKGFLISHLINTAAIAGVASQSVRAERWSIVAIQAALPIVVDLSARHIFGSNAVSPWAFSVAPYLENQNYSSALMLSYSW